jgi:electron transfer flavoprotein alpha/beta subunit
MKARKKELKEIPLAEAGASDSLQVETLTLVPPSVREAGKTVETVDELVELLHSEAKLI